MAWNFAARLVEQAKDLGDLTTLLGAELLKLQRLVRCYEPTAPLTYGTTVTPVGSLSRHQQVIATNGVAFAIGNPVDPREGVRLTLEVFNNTAGVLGAVTFGNQFTLVNGAWVSPAAGKRRMIEFIRTSDRLWRETWRSSADF